jgi:hypothetical protein
MMGLVARNLFLELIDQTLQRLQRNLGQLFVLARFGSEGLMSLFEHL